MTTHAPCDQDTPGCTCQGDPAVHEAASRRGETATQAPAPADALAPCPECDRPTPPAQLDTWGNCRVCRTAQSRSVQPLRW